MIPGRHPGGVNVEEAFRSCQRPFRRSCGTEGSLTAQSAESRLLVFLPAWNTPAKRGYTGPRSAGRIARGRTRAPAETCRATDSERHATDVQEAQQQEAAEGPRISRPHEVEGRPASPVPPTKEGPKAPHRERRVPPQAAQSLSPARSRRTSPAPPHMKDERLPRAARIGSGREIRELLRNGRRCRLGPIDLFVAPAGRDRPRVGVVVPRYGRSAVERNRLRRRVREIARREWLPVARRREDHLDVVVRARREAYESTFDELREIVVQRVERPCSG